MSEQRRVRFLDLAVKDNFPEGEWFKSVLRSGKFILSENVDEFERKFAEYCGAKYCIGVGNGFDALQIIMRSIGIGAGDHVLVPSNAPLPVFMSVSVLGAQPIPIEPYQYGHVLDPLWLTKSNTVRIKSKSLKAMIAVHMYGMVAPIHTLKELSDGLPIIEDCCQAHGARLADKHVGNFGIAGAFSFYPTKNMGAYGDAGAIITNDENIYHASLEIREYGKGNRIGINSRLDEVQAAMLFNRLWTLDEENKQRREKVSLYREKLRDLIGIDVPAPMMNTIPVYHQFAVLCDKRDELKSFLEKNGIETMIHYPVPAWRMPVYGQHWAFPISDWQAKHILSLPIGRGVTMEDVEYVCERIRTFYGENV